MSLKQEFLDRMKTLLNDKFDAFYYALSQPIQKAVYVNENKISVEEALGMSDTDFKTNTVFYCYPSSMNEPTIPLLVRGAHLAIGIPALTPATGVTDLSTILDQENNFNLDLSGPGIDLPNGWPNRSDYPNRWLHSDIKDLSYFINFSFYEKAIEKGGLK